MTSALPLTPGGFRRPGQAGWSAASGHPFSGWPGCRRAAAKGARCRPRWSARPASSATAPPRDGPVGRDDLGLLGPGRQQVSAVVRQLIGVSHPGRALHDEDQFGVGAGSGNDPPRRPARRAAGWRHAAIRHRSDHDGRVFCYQTHPRRYTATRAILLASVGCRDRPGGGTPNWLKPAGPSTLSALPIMVADTRR